MNTDDLIARVDDLIAKGDRVLSTHRPNPPNVIGFPTLDSGAFSEWQTQVLTFLVNVLGSEHIYVTSLTNKVDSGHRSSVEAGQGILRALREDLSLGYLTNLRTLVTADLFSDFIEMAEHLLEAGYKDPAASLAGAVLEDGLRQIATKNNLKLKAREDLSSLNQKCADAAVYNRLVQKKVNVWIDVRNRADHAQFGEYSDVDVQQMLSGVTDFLSSHLV